MLLVIVGGALSYMGLSSLYLSPEARWSFWDCVYMTVISITTVGFSETLDVASVPYARALTVFIIFSGLGVAAYFASTLTAFVVEGQFFDVRKRRKMRSEIERTSGHIVVCGLGTSGLHVVEELLASKWRVVCIEMNKERVQKLQTLPHGAHALYVIGDATDDETLREAGIDRAHGIVAALPSDKDNLFVVISARQLNPRLRIVVKAVDIASAEKLRRAGADGVVTPAFIGGMRMASEMIRPQVTEFLDVMLREKDATIRMEEVTLPTESNLVGKTLADARIRETTNLLIVAVRMPNNGGFLYNPGPRLKLEAGMSLIVLGDTANVQKLRAAVGHRSGQLPTDEPRAP